MTDDNEIYHVYNSSDEPGSQEVNIEHEMTYDDDPMFGHAGDESIGQTTFTPQAEAMSEQNEDRLARQSAVSTFFSKLALFFAALGTLLVLTAYFPSIYYFLAGIPGKTVEFFKLDKTEVEALSGKTNQPQDYLPAFDPKLPVTNHITITALGVDTEIQEATYDNYEEALKKGVWRVSDFGAPTDSGLPTILAAHRFGYLIWTNRFRRENSFYNLPKLREGDTVEIVWRQRKYTYEIYGGSEGEQISDYSADLILYTCETLNGPIRIFRYARLLKL